MNQVKDDLLHKLYIMFSERDIANRRIGNRIVFEDGISPGILENILEELKYRKHGEQWVHAEYPEIRWVETEERKSFKDPKEPKKLKSKLEVVIDCVYISL